MKPFIAFALFAASLATTAAPALAKNDKAKGHDKAKFELKCPPGLARQGLCDGGKIKVKIKEKKGKDHRPGIINVEIKGLEGGKRKIELGAPVAAAVLAAPAVAATPRAAPVASVAPATSLYPRPAPSYREISTGSDVMIEADPRRTVLSTREETDLNAASRRTQVVTEVESGPRRITLGEDAPSILAAPSGEPRIERIAGGAKMVRPELRTVSLDDGSALSRGARLDADARARYVSLRNPALFGLPALPASQSYMRVGDTAVVIDEPSGEILDLVPLGSITID